MKIEHILSLAIPIGLGVFLFFTHVNSAATGVVITEIAAHEARDHEWIEIYNNSEDPVDLTDWIFWEDETNHGLELIQGDDAALQPDAYAIIAQNSDNFLTDYPDVEVQIFDSSWQALNESGEEIGLKDADDEFVEQFIYIESTETSLERKDVSAEEYSEENWQTHPDSATPGEENFWFVETPEEENNEAEENADGQEEEIPNDENNEAEEEHNEEEDTQDNAQEEAEEEQNEENNENEPDDEEQPEVHDGSPQHIVINEIYPNPSEGNEWIELFNTSASSTILDGLTITDGVGIIASPTGTIAGSNYVLINLTKSALNNDGDIVSLLNEDNTSIDSIAYGDWEESIVQTPDKGHTLARPSAEENVVITTSPTPNAANVISLPQQDEPQENNSGGSGGGGGDIPQLSTANPSDVVINEFVSDPTDGGVEFVELYNTTNEPIILDSWSLEEGSEATTALDGSIDAGGFITIEKPKGNLNNGGDIIILTDGNTTIIDQVSYGSWDDGNLSNNAPAAEDPMSLARRRDGVDSDNDLYDFVLTDTVTKNARNIITTPKSEEGETGAPSSIPPGTLVLNEILPNPEGSDGEAEFIELKNIGEETIHLQDITVTDGSKKYALTEQSLAPQKLLLLKRSQTKIALNNTGGETVTLLSGDTTLDSAVYTGSADEDHSYARTKDAEWVWSTKPTPGKENIITTVNEPPVISIDTDVEAVPYEPIVFDASDTIDPDGDPLTFHWNFDDGEEDEGDAVEHMFRQEGMYTVKLTVTDEQGNEETEKVIVTVKYDDLSGMGGSAMLDLVEQIRISEFMPNPEGSDTTEFIELYNPTTEIIDLSNIKLDDEDGGSRAYSIPSGTFIEAESYMIFPRQETKIALNNTDDAVRLLYPDNALIQEVRYDDVTEGASHIQDTESGVWIVTSEPTPGAANTFKQIVQKSSRRSSSRSSRASKAVIATTVAGIKDEDIGDLVQITGKVAVEPGVYGSQYFYLLDPSPSSTAGIQIYMHKKEFPSLRPGDTLEVTGEISQAYGETRVKVKEKTDMKKQKHTGQPNPTLTDIAAINESFQGAFVQVHGEITEKKSTYMYVDDGTEELKVAFKRGAGIETKTLAVGDLVTIHGILQQRRDGMQLLPRSHSDIQKTGVSEDAVEQQVALQKEDEQEVAEKYLTATAGGLTSLLVGLVAKVHGSTAMKFLKKIGIVAVAIRRKFRG